ASDTNTQARLNPLILIRTFFETRSKAGSFFAMEFIRPGATLMTPVFFARTRCVCFQIESGSI
ncbi:MAG: hypothetical protein JRD68_14535, partial [Deltaproteobacteria bacterium]|nr:hypothetical protein [Deltaproteobacteria bacterium]